MKTYLVSLASILLLVSTSSVEANHIVYGEFSGVIIGSSGGFPYSIGDPISGTFRYDRDLLLSGSAEGYLDPSFEFFAGGVVGFAPFVVDGRIIFPTSCGFSVDANGFPYEGGGASAFDLYISPGGLLGFHASTYGGGAAQVTYSIVGVPETATTSILLGIACGTLAVFKRSSRNA